MPRVIAFGTSLGFRSSLGRTFSRSPLGFSTICLIFGPRLERRVNIIWYTSWGQYAPRECTRKYLASSYEEANIPELQKVSAYLFGNLCIVNMLKNAKIITNIKFERNCFA